MKKILFPAVLSLLFFYVDAQLQVISTGRVYTLNKSVHTASINSDMIDVTNTASNVSSGVDLIWTNYNSSTQPYNPGLLRLSSAYSTKFIVKSNGSVGIGTSSPSSSYILDVVGDVRINGTLTVTSDEKLKDNIEALANAKTSLFKLNGVTYNYITTTEQLGFGKNGEAVYKDSVKMKPNEVDPGFYQRKHIGFLAQDVQKAFPELVFEDSIGILSVDYLGLIPVLVEALKAQDTVLNSQNVKIADLETRVSALETALINASTKKSASAGVSDNSSDIPVLSQNEPNPFNLQTAIDYYVPESASQAMINIYTLNGNSVLSINISETGRGKIIIKGSELQPGMYLYVLIVDGNIIDTKRMILTE